MIWQQLLAGLSQARQPFDRQIERLCSKVKSDRVSIYCQKGCANCCTLAVNCSFPEALAIARALESEQKQALKVKIPRLQQVSRQAKDLKMFLRTFRDQLGGCPFLATVDGSCSIYPQRPFSCRALISTRNSSWCGVDFSSLHPQEKTAFISSLDPELVAFPSHYLAATQELGLEFESQARVAMRDSFGFSLTGNLLYLVWLELEQRLSEVIPNGAVVTRKFLEEQQLDLPFLLQLQSNQ
ncbi:MAG TPA: YkgJ family cysteine cluster protein [Malonomonas sp.]